MDKKIFCFNANRIFQFLLWFVSLEHYEILFSIKFIKMFYFLVKAFRLLYFSLSTNRVLTYTMLGILYFSQ